MDHRSCFAGTGFPDARPANQARILACVLGMMTTAFASAAIAAAPPPNATPEQKSWWAFQPLRSSPALPAVKRSAAVRTPVDRFVLARQEAQGLTLLPPADKATLLRRVSFDLIGLPPSPADIDAFTRDPSPQAFNEVIERLLASPRYGERWGRHWMDVVRYADTAGDNADYPVPEAYRYRDYIIDAFNRDKPYDVFIREQLAGDILAAEGPRERYAEQVVATGFLALSRRYATAPFELMHLTIEDAIETTGRAFLGLSLRCARCHDHKFDPVTARDYYGLYGFFASTRFPYAGSEEFQSKNLPRTGFLPLVPPTESARPIEENRKRLESLRAQLEGLEKESAKGKTKGALKSEIEGQLVSLRRELKRRERSGALPDLPVAYAVADDKPTDQAVHIKGDPAQLGDVAPRCLPAFLSGQPGLSLKPGSSGRRELASWIASPDNPLTARVMANRVWHYHFGRGLAASPSNLGLRGETPTHPELLDYLAGYLIDHGWSVKSLHRLILNSATWRQQARGAQSQSESAARLLVGFERQRLDAESIRDAMMTTAGTLDLAPPEAHPFPPIEDWHWTQHNPFKVVYESSHRSVYLMRQRLQRHPYLSLFDAPDANMSTDVRTRATVPQQALYLMNNPFVRTQAAAFADRVINAGSTDEARISEAVALAWSRRPGLAEEKGITAYLRRYEAQARKEGVGEQEATKRAWESEARVLMTASEFFYLD
ncbi:MAG: DUF1549 domain-containing protein [Verrucomicrobia bacterium]|nr:DUF1549 domain-containing protein [Verrucomicrobiota bacterium]MBI3871172.1 DUF1549 domain-containing protein [Verrucomicrobiota bacterium]